MKLFKPKDQEMPLETLESQLTSARQALAEFERLSGVVSRYNWDTARVRQQAEANRLDPLWRADHSAADLAELDRQVDEALRAEGAAILDLHRFEAAKGNRAGMTRRVEDLESQLDEEAKNEARRAYKELAREQLALLAPLYPNALKMNHAFHAAEKRWGSQYNPLREVGLPAQFFADKDFPESQSRTPFGLAKISIGVVYPDLFEPTDPLMRDIRAARETFGWD